MNFEDINKELIKEGTRKIEYYIIKKGINIGKNPSLWEAEHSHDWLLKEGQTQEEVENRYKEDYEKKIGIFFGVFWNTDRNHLAVCFEDENGEIITIKSDYVRFVK